MMKYRRNTIAAAINLSFDILKVAFVFIHSWEYEFFVTIVCVCVCVFMRRTQSALHMICVHRECESLRKKRTRKTKKVENIWYYVLSCLKYLQIDRSVEFKTQVCGVQQLVSITSVECFTTKWNKSNYSGKVKKTPNADACRFLWNFWCLRWKKKLKHTHTGLGFYWANGIIETRKSVRVLVKLELYFESAHSFGVFKLHTHTNNKY